VAQKFFVLKNGKEYGPYTPQELKMGAETGGLVPEDQIRTEDGRNWIVATAIEGLFAIPRRESKANPPPLPVARPLTASAASPPPLPPAGIRTASPSCPPPLPIAASPSLPPPIPAVPPNIQTADESGAPLDCLTAASTQKSSAHRSSLSLGVPSRAIFPLCWLGVILLAVGAVWFAYTWDKARRIRNAMEIGGDLWNKGEKDKAIDEYKQVLDVLSAGPDSSNVYQRVIDYNVEKKDLVSARQITDTAKIRGIAVRELEVPHETPFVISKHVEDKIGKSETVGGDSLSDDYHHSAVEEPETRIVSSQQTDVASLATTPASNNRENARTTSPPDSERISTTPTTAPPGAAATSHRPSYSWNDTAVIKCELKHPFANMSVALSPDISLIAFCGSDSPVKLYDVASGKEIGTLNGETDSTTRDIIFSKDNKRLAWTNVRGVCIWNVPDNHIMKSLDSPEHIRASTFASSTPFSPDGKTIATHSGGNVVLWDTVSWKRLKELPYWHAVFSPDGKTIATYSGGNVVLWDTASWKQLETLPGCKFALFSHDGTLLAMEGILKDTVMLWDLKLDKPRCTLKRETKEYYAESYSLTNDGKSFVRFHDDEFKLWDTLSGETETNLKPGDNVYAWALSGDGSFLVIGGGRRLSTNAGMVTVCDLNTGQVAYLTGHKERVNSMSLSDDGQLLATMSSDRTIRLWKRSLDSTGRFAFVKAPQQFFGDAVDPEVRGPNGEKVMVGGDGLNSDWFFHYYLDKDGKQIQHGTSRVPYTGAVSGRGRRESNYDRGTLLSRSLYGSDGTLTTQYQQVKDNTYQRDEYRSISDGSRVHLRSLITISNTDTGEECTTIKDREVVSDEELLPPAAGRELKVSIETAGHTSDPIVTMFNSSLKSIKCYATSNELIIDLLDVDGTPWQGEQRAGWILALLVRLFDGNGNHITHFTTTEGFTLDWDAYNMHTEKYENAKRVGMTVDGHGNPVRKPTLLKRKANRLTYTVNMSDLRDAAKVEIGFMEPGH
jgi:WD40 repeat protein